jgi:hypothetical protein
LKNTPWGTHECVRHEVFMTLAPAGSWELPHGSRFGNIVSF